LTPKADLVAGIVSIIAIRPLSKSEGPLLDRPRPVKPYQTIDPAQKESRLGKVAGTRTARRTEVLKGPRTRRGQ